MTRSLLIGAATVSILLSALASANAQTSFCKVTARGCHGVETANVVRTSTCKIVLACKKGA